MTDKFIKRVPLKWDFKETVGYADLYKTDDGSIVAKAQILDSETQKFTGCVIKKNLVDKNGDMLIGEVK